MHQSVVSQVISSAKSKFSVSKNNLLIYNYFQLCLSLWQSRFFIYMTKLQSTIEQLILQKISAFSMDFCFRIWTVGFFFSIAHLHVGINGYNGLVFMALVIYACRCRSLDRCKFDSHVWNAHLNWNSPNQEYQILKSLISQRLEHIFNEIKQNSCRLQAT